MKRVYKQLYEFRFEFFFFTLLFILLGSIIFPFYFFEGKISPILFLTNIASGILLLSKNKYLFRFYLILFTISLIIFGLRIVQNNSIEAYAFIRLINYFVFYTSVTYTIIKQVWYTKHVTKNVIFGLMSGYISLGLIAFFLFISIEIASPGSFGGILLDTTSIDKKIDSLLYYAYITLLTIGYGDIVPVTPIAQKASILVGLMGQFYIVIITAVVIEKYIRHSVDKR